MLDVLLIKYQQFNNSSVPNKLAENVKCKMAVEFNNIPCNLKVVILPPAATNLTAKTAA